MSVLTSLAAVVFAIYVLGSIRLAPRSSWLFTSVPGFGVVAQRRGLAVGERSVLRIGTLEPGGIEASAQPWPISLLPDGVSSAPTHGMAPEDRAPDAAWRRSYEELKTAGSEGKVVTLGPDTGFTAASPEEAKWWVKTLQGLSATPVPERPQVIEAALRSWLDVASLGDHLQHFQASTRRLRTANLSLLLFVFVALPTLTLLGPWASVWTLLALYLLLLLWVEIEFMLSHRALFPTRRWERFGRSLLHIVSPADAMASASKLASATLSPYHPVALALVLCGHTERNNVASSCLRALRFPRRSPSVGALDAAQVIEGCLKEAGVDFDGLLAPPSVRDPGCLSYCPHCREQFVVQDADCPECLTVALLPFPDETGRATNTIEARDHAIPSTRG